MTISPPQLDRDFDELLRTAFRPIVDLRHGVAAAFETASCDAVASAVPLFLNVGDDIVDGVPANAVILTSSETVVRHYAARGFPIALDDAASERRSLPLLLSCSYLKFAYDASKLRAMVALAHNIGAVPIAGGVAAWDEAETLMRGGVEWAEGSLFGPATPRPERLDRAVSRHLVQMWTRLR
ncbi:MAG TPA: hypothetical protein VJZ76_17010 [Thermoanaerobaculia bacterium]|nr:hypothetical protein [Thermoanaerobaculia bacterium]